MNSIAITPIGTCRINTPLRRAARYYPITINVERVYGFTHTSDEALQQLLFLQGEKTFDERSSKVLFRRGRDYNSAPHDAWKLSELTIVEISSAKKITALGDSLQINYLYKMFPAFFAQHEQRTRFWSLARGTDRQALQDFLEAQASFRDLDSDARALISSLRMEIQSNEAICRDMAEIVERLGADKVLFVTHVNAITQDSGIIAERDRVIRAVRSGAEMLGAACYEPTDAMFRVGQDVAMERGGTDLTHYTLAFSDFVFHEIHKQHLVPKFGARIEPEDDNYPDRIEQQIVATKIAMAIERDPEIGERELAIALADHPLSQPLAELSGRLSLKRGDIAGAIAVLAPMEAARALTFDGRRQLLEALVAAERWTEAIETFNNLLGDEYDGVDILCLGATVNEQLGELEQATALWMRAFRSDYAQIAAAISVLSFLKAQGFDDRAEAWRAEMIENADLDQRSAAALRSWAKDNGEMKLLLLVLDHDVRYEAIYTISQLLESGEYDAAAAAFIRIAGQMSSETDSKTVDAFQRLVKAVRRQSDEAYSAGRYRAGYILEAAVSEVTGLEDSEVARKAKREFELSWREHMVEQDHAAVDQFARSAPELAMSIERRVLRWSVSLHKLGRDQEALDIAQKSRENFPENTAITRWLARIAAIVGRYDIAITHYALLRDSGTPDADRFKAETEKFFARAEARALSQMAKCSDSGDFQLAVGVANAIIPYVTEPEIFATAKNRLMRKLWQQVRKLETSNAPTDELETQLRLTLSIDPHHLPATRRLASLVMKQENYVEAARLWSRVVEVDPTDETGIRKLHRCIMLKSRMTKPDAVA